jgi:hypothetical protein
VSHVPVRPKDKARLISMNENYKGTHRNKPENYFLGLLDIKGVLLIHLVNSKAAIICIKL